MIRRRVVASGRVQGVWYRDLCRHQAEELGVTGWVANRADGTVEAVFEGDQGAVERMVAWSRVGSPRSRVDRVAVTEETPQGERGFRVRG